MYSMSLIPLYISVLYERLVYSFHPGWRIYWHLKLGCLMWTMYDAEIQGLDCSAKAKYSNRLVEPLTL